MTQSRYPTEKYCIYKLDIIFNVNIRNPCPTQEEFVTHIRDVNLMDPKAMPLLATRVPCSMDLNLSQKVTDEIKMKFKSLPL